MSFIPLILAKILVGDQLTDRKRSLGGQEAEPVQNSDDLLRIAGPAEERIPAPMSTGRFDESTPAAESGFGRRRWRGFQGRGHEHGARLDDGFSFVKPTPAGHGVVAGPGRPGVHR